MNTKYAFIIRMSGSDYTYVKTFNPLTGKVTTTENQLEAIRFDSQGTIDEFLAHVVKFDLNGYPIEGRADRIVIK